MAQIQPEVIVGTIDVSLRDFFAAAVLAGMMATRRQEFPEFSPNHDATYCYRVADAMLAERQKGRGE